MTFLDRINSSMAVLLLCGAAALHGQHSQQPAPSKTSSTVTAPSGIPEIPFELVNNHLVLEVSVNGAPPLDVVLDTGMPAGGLAIYDGPKTPSLGLDIDPNIQARIGGAGGDGERRTARMAMNESISLPGLEMDNVRVIVMPAMPHFSGYHDGIIGYSIFERFVVELDYERSLMRLHDPVSYKAPPDSQIIPMAVEGRQPYVTAKITSADRAPFDAKVVVDLGASHAISLNTDWSEKISVPETSLKTMVGHGLSGPLEGEFGRIASLELGSLKLHDVLASFPVSAHQNPRGTDSLAGNLGSEVLRRFRTTFDYAGGRMILEPNQSFEDPFVFDHSGMHLAPGRELEVRHVIDDSPADQAGVDVGDIVTHIDGKAVTGADYGGVRRTLMKPGPVKLSILRGEEALEIDLALRRMI